MQIIKVSLGGYIMYHYTLTMDAQKDRKDPVKDIPLPLPDPPLTPVHPRLFVD